MTAFLRIADLVITAIKSLTFFNLNCSIFDIFKAPFGWREGSFLIIDDSFEHEVWNESEDESRLILLLDMWHPRVKDEDKLRLEPLQRDKKAKRTPVYDITGDAVSKLKTKP